MTALLLAIVGVIIFAVGFFAGAVAMGSAYHEIENENEGKTND